MVTYDFLSILFQFGIFLTTFQFGIFLTTTLSVVVGILVLVTNKKK